MCDNTLLLADKCENWKPDTSFKTPHWSAVQPDEDAATKLRQLVAEALRERGLNQNPKRYIIDGREVTYCEQAELELERFISKGFASYCLITWDLIQYGKRQGWPFGPRGSVGGSLVCFLLGITSIDPLRWNLSFDRFLASSRGGYLLKVTMA
jgi:DNA polymerase III alpha subunit